MGSFADQKKKTETNILPHRKAGVNFSDTDVYNRIPDNLNEIEIQIDRMVGKTWEYAWYIGTRLNIIDKDFLQETKYSSINEYAKERFGFSYRTIDNFRFLSKHFSRTQALAYGSKLYLLSKLDNNEKQNYLEWIEQENPTYREIEDKINSEFKKPGRPKQDINLSKSKMTVDFNRIGKYIPKEKQEDFLNELKELIEKYSSSK